MSFTVEEIVQELEEILQKDAADRVKIVELQTEIEELVGGDIERFVVEMLENPDGVSDQYPDVEPVDLMRKVDRAHVEVNRALRRAGVYLRRIDVLNHRLNILRQGGEL